MGRFHVKRLALVVGVLGLLLVDWAALHDILAAEPDVWTEWAILGLSLVAFGLLIRKVRILRSQERGERAGQ